MQTLRKQCLGRGEGDSKARGACARTDERDARTVLCRLNCLRHNMILPNSYVRRANVHAQ